VTDEILDPLRVFVSDKEFAKLYVKAVIGDEFNIPTISVIRSLKEMQNFSFPSSCAIKPTHASGRIIIRKQDEPVDIEEMKKWFDVNYYRQRREANYKTLKPKIIVESLITHPKLIELQVFCLNGMPKTIKTKLVREQITFSNWFDLDWNEYEISTYFPRYTEKIERPNELSKILSVASRLSEPFGFIRVDLYNDGHNVWVGELTNCDNSAGSVFNPRSAEYLISRMIFNSSQ
jgi:hypothetical protein